MNRCVTGKKCYATIEMAEDALIEAHINFIYAQGQGPVAVYRCDDCGDYHLTSSGLTNERLLDAMHQGYIKRQREALQWQQRLKKGSHN